MLSKRKTLLNICNDKRNHQWNQNALAGVKQRVGTRECGEQVAEHYMTAVSNLDLTGGNWLKQE